jgi:hypothetical protein
MLPADATSRPLLLAGFEGIFYGRFWVITEALVGADWEARIRTLLTSVVTCDPANGGQFGSGH